MNNYISHYASPYYDPEKAHEYYMRTRELKGRKSTAGLNDEGKAAAKYVKEQLTSERKQVISDKKDEHTNINEAYKNQMQSKIDSLRAKLKRMSKFEKRKHRETIQNQITMLREENKSRRKELSEQLKNFRTETKELYDEKYISELDKIKSDSKFIKIKKKSKKTSTS
jgi:hypothetical protein